jgi:hypothetical protein
VRKRLLKRAYLDMPCTCMTISGVTSQVMQTHGQAAAQSRQTQTCRHGKYMCVARRSQQRLQRAASGQDVRCCVASSNSPNRSMSVGEVVEEAVGTRLKRDMKRVYPCENAASAAAFLRAKSSVKREEAGAPRAV